MSFRLGEMKQLLFDIVAVCNWLAAILDQVSVCVHLAGAATVDAEGSHRGFGYSYGGILVRIWHESCEFFVQAALEAVPPAQFFTLNP